MIDKLWEATLSRIIKKDKHLRNTVKKYGNDILNTPSYQQSKDFIQHGKKSVFQHSIDVAKMSLKISRTLPFQFKESELVRGALLHDYFLYDWHDLKIPIKNPKDFFKLHGFTHANTALKNAKRDFVLSENEKEIIKKHMWPLNIKPPMSREAWVVTMADKICSIKETVHRR